MSRVTCKPTASRRHGGGLTVCPSRGQWIGRVSDVRSLSPRRDGSDRRGREHLGVVAGQDDGAVQPVGYGHRSGDCSAVRATPRYPSHDAIVRGHGSRQMSQAVADQAPLTANLPKALDHQRLADANDEQLLVHRDPAVPVDDDESAVRRLQRIADCPDPRQASRPRPGRQHPLRNPRWAGQNRPLVGTAKPASMTSWTYWPVLGAHRGRNRDRQVGRLVERHLAGIRLEPDVLGERNHPRRPAAGHLRQQLCRRRRELRHLLHETRALANVDATASWSIASTASTTLAFEGRSSALVSSAGSGGASMPPGSAGATNNRIPMTDAIDWRVVYRAARPWTTLRSWPSGTPVRMEKGLSPSVSIR